MKILDLSDASIVEGGEAYYSSYTTENNVLGNSMFYGSATLESVILPKNITTIEKEAFRGCSNLISITIFENVKSIGNMAFYGSSLSEIDIPKGVETIGYGAFHFCNLSEITIPEGVKTIEYCAFSDNKNLKSVTIPQSVTSIGREAFGYHRGIDVYIKDLRKFLEACISEPKIFTSNYDEAYYRLFLNNVEVKDLIIPEGVTGIPYFARCSSLISVTLPEGAYCKFAGYFSECKNLEQAKFPNSYPIIPPGTFANSGLKTMTIGNNVTTIYYGAFSYCPLNAFYSYTQTPPILDCIPEGMNTSNMPTEIRYSFGGVNKDNATLYVPAGCKTAYEASDWAKFFGTIVEMN